MMTEECKARLLEEEKLLLEKCIKLHDFLQSVTYAKLNFIDAQLLIAQYHAMKSYHTILMVRIEKL